MPTYSFQMSAGLAGSSVSVTAVGSSTVVASGTLDTNALFTASLPVGDYVAKAADGHYSYSSAGTVAASDPDQLADLNSTIAAPLKLGTKAMPWSFGVTGGHTNTTLGIAAPGLTLRYPVRLPGATSRWRLHIANIDGRTAAATAGTFVFNGVYVGKTSNATRATPDGAFSATPTQALAGWTADLGTEYVSPWVTAAGAQFGADEDWLISIGYTGGTAAGVVRGYGGCAYIPDSAAVAQVGNANIANANVSLFDCWIEYETYGDYPTGLYIGDSLTLGRKAAAELYILSSYPASHAIRARSLPLNAGMSGSTFSEWTSPTSYRWTKWGTRSFDYALITLGSNDISNGSDLATFQSNFGQVVANARSVFGVKRIYTGTIMPRSFAAGPEAVRVSVNNWLQGLPFGIQGCFRFHERVQNPADVTKLLPEFDSGDTVHMNGAGYAAMAAAIPGRLA